MKKITKVVICVAILMLVVFGSTQILVKTAHADTKVVDLENDNAFTVAENTELATEPETEVTETEVPETTEPEVLETEPETTEPLVVYNPNQTPVETVPQESEPMETEPTETQPQIDVESNGSSEAEEIVIPTEPEATEPTETQPQETEPQETEPQETEPTETQPQETESESDKTQGEEEEKKEHYHVEEKIGDILYVYDSDVASPFYCYEIESKDPIEYWEDGILYRYSPEYVGTTMIIYQPYGNYVQG